MYIIPFVWSCQYLLALGAKISAVKVIVVKGHKLQTVVPVLREPVKPILENLELEN